MEGFTETFTRTFVMQKSWARSGTLTRIFAEVAEEAYAQWIDEMDNREDEPSDDAYSEKRDEQDSLLIKLGIKSIVFTAMALEAGVFDLAAIHLGDKTANRLDKLDLKGKWLIVPQLVCGRSLAEDGPALNELNSLSMARNDLVHHKSKPFPGYKEVPNPAPNSEAQWTEESIKEVEEFLKNLAKGTARFEGAVRASFPTLVRISLELESLLGNPGPLPRFSRNDEPNDSRTPLLKTVIGDCRARHLKYQGKA